MVRSRQASLARALEVGGVVSHLRAQVTNLLPGMSMGLAATYLAAAHLSRVPGLIRQALGVMAISGAAVAGLSLISLAGALTPTAYSLTGPATLSFSRDLPGGALTLPT